LSHLPLKTRRGLAQAGRVSSFAAALLLAGAVGANAQAPTLLPNWNQLSPTNSPAGRFSPAMAYDAQTGQVVLFGGQQNNTQLLNDTWLWNGTNWAQANPSTVPSARSAEAMAYDAATGQVVMFGGYTGGAPDGDTWVWNGSNWTEAAVSGPSPRCNTTMVYDAATQQVVLFGGTVGGQDSFGDTWVWNGTSWSEAATAGPSARAGQGMAYDAALGEVVLFGGYTEGEFATYLSDTWVWNGSWSQVIPAGVPSARWDLGMDYDAATGQVFLFGGDFNGVFYGDTWVFNGSSWSQVSSGGPSGREVQNGLVYDAAQQQMVLFGGFDGNSPGDGDTWEYGPPQNFSNVNVCPPTASPTPSCTNELTLTYSVPVVTTFGTPKVVVQGAASNDFTLASNGCTGAVSANSSCNETVAFTPQAPGLRAGAVELFDTSNPANLLVATPIYGVGEGPELAFGPTIYGPAIEYGPSLENAVPTTGYTLGNPGGLATDAAGDLFIADPDYQRVVKVAAGGTTSTVGAGLVSPQAIAVDGAGDLYIADTGLNPGNGEVLEVPAGCTSVGCQIAVYAPVVHPSPVGVAVDGIGDLFISDNETGVIEIPANGSGQTTVYNPGGSSSLSGIAVDAAGDLFVTDSGLGQVVEIPPGCNASGCQIQIIANSWIYPRSVAVDAAGDLYVSDSGLENGGEVLEIPAGCTSTACEVPLFNDSASFGVAVDSAGEVYIAENAYNQVFKVNQSESQLLTEYFSPTTWGVESPDSPQSLTLLNVGNQTLNAISPGFAIGQDWLQDATGFSPNCSGSYSLAPGQGCNLSIDFEPTGGSGPTPLITSAIYLFNNSLNGNYLQENIDLQGSASGGGGGTTYAVTVTGVNPGSGSVVSITDDNISCTITNGIASGNCSYGYPSGSVVTLVANGNGSTFAGWGGACAGQGTGQCSLTINGNENITASFIPPNYGAANVCSSGSNPPCSTSIPVTFFFQANGTTVGSVQVVTQGYTNLDFQEVNDNCSNQTFNQGQSCTVNVTFTPQAVGLRLGAVELLEPSSSTVELSQLIYGTGSGAVAAFSPITSFGRYLGGPAPGHPANSIPLNNPQGVAVDANDNVFLSDSANHQVLELAGNNTTVVYNGTLLSSSSVPQGLAVDGAGDLYVADPDLGQVLEVVPNGNGYITVYSGVSPTGVAVDGTGDVFVADENYQGLGNGGAVLEIPANGTQTLLYESEDTVPVGLAVDAAGNVFVTDTAYSAVVEIPLGCDANNYNNCQTTVGSGWSTPEGVALDAAGDVYVTDIGLDFGAGAVVEVPAGCTNNTCELPIANSVKSYSVAVDALGVVNYVNYGSGSNTGGLEQVLQQFYGFGFSPTVVYNISGDSPKSVTLQNVGNQQLTASLNITDPDFTQANLSSPGQCTTTSFSLAAGATCNLSINFEPLTGGSLSGNATFTDNARNNSPLSQSFGLSGTGIPGFGSDYLTVTEPGSGSGAVTSADGLISCSETSGSVTGICLAAYSNDFVMLTATAANGSTFTGWGGACANYGTSTQCSVDVNEAQNVSANFGQANFGTVGVCAGGNTSGCTGSSQTVTFSFTQSIAVSQILAVTLGATGLDFTAVNSGSCINNFNSGDSCTANVTFTPTAPGLRRGAVELLDDSGNVLLTQPISGIGQGPEAAFSPGNQTTVSAVGLNYPVGVALDGAGNLYIANYGSSNRAGYVVKVTPGGVQTTVLSAYTSAPGQAPAPVGVAVDGAGDLFIVDLNLPYAVELTPSGVQTTVGSGLNYPIGIALDGAGDVFIGDQNNKRVVEVTPSGVQTTVPFTGLQQPWGVAVDAAGDVFVADGGNQSTGGSVPPSVLEVTPSGVQTTVPTTGLGQPYDLAVDAAGDVFIADAPNARVLEVTPSGVQTTANPTILDYPSGITVDAAGDIFIGDQGAQTVYEVNGSAPLVSFGITGNTYTTPDTPLTVQNVGNQTLSGSVGAVTGAYISEDTGNSNCGSFTLAPAASCTNNYTATPTALGLYSGSAVATDNSLNGNPATQTINFTGLSYGPTVTLAATGAGTGSGLVYSNLTGLDCNVTAGVNSGPACSYGFSSGFTVTVYAIPSNGSTFTSWGGACASAGTGGPSGGGCTLLLTANTNVTANFSANIVNYTLAVTDLGSGSGSVTSNSSASPAISCVDASGGVSGTCSENDQSGTQVTLTAIPAAGSSFVGWGGACASSGTSATCTVTMNAGESVSASFAPSNFGSANVCPQGGIGQSPCSITKQLTFTPVATVTNASVQVVTQGTPGLDFSIGTGCTGTIAANSSCSVQVTFTPQAPGLRMGAVELSGVANSVSGLVTTIPIYGVGQAPEIAFGPTATYLGFEDVTYSSQVTGVPNLSYSNGMTTDAAGNLYQAVGANLLKVMPGGTPTTIATGFGSLEDVAIDGAGNLYVADVSINTNGELLKLAPGCATASCASVLYAAPSHPGPYGVAVDGSGDVFFTRGTTGATEIPAGCSNSSCYISLYSPGGSSSSGGVALDAAGDLFVADSGLHQVVKIPVGCNANNSNNCQTAVGSGWVGPQSVGVDAAGDVIVADPTLTIDGSIDAGGVVEVPAGCTTPSCQILLWSGGAPDPFFLTINATGQIFVTTDGTPVIEINQPQLPSLNFGTTTAAGTRSSPQPVTLQNIGNQGLSISAMSVGSPFDQILNNNDNPADCANGGNFTLSVGQSCTVSISFEPLAAQSYNADLTITEDSLNTDFSPFQQIALAGTATPAVVTNYTLAVTDIGTGSGTVTSNSSASPAINCATSSGSVAGTCSESDASGAQVTLTASASAGSAFLGWGGACASSGTNSTCVVTTNAAENVTASFSPQNFGSNINVCPSDETTPSPAPCSIPQTVTFNLVATTNIGAIQVVTQGVTGLDFALGTGSTCTGTISAGNSCGVNVTFTPLAPGLRTGEVELYASNGNLVASTPIYGIAQGPEVAFNPATPVAVNTGSSYPLTAPNGVAVDAAGDVFIANTGNIVKVAANGNVSTVGTGLGDVLGLAVDGAGDVFAAETGAANQVVEVSANGGTQTVVYPQSGTSGSNPVGLALDATGDLFIADDGLGEVVELPVGCGGCQNVPYGPYGSGERIGGLAVDGAGDVFVPDATQHWVVEITPAGGFPNSVGSGWNQPDSVAVDAAGNVYVADIGLGAVMEVPNGPSSAISLESVSSSGVAVDGSGDVFIVEDSSNQVAELHRSQPPSLSFALTNVGSPSSPQSVSVQNVGNQPLTGSLLLSLGGNFTENLSPDCSGKFPLAPGASCSESFSFTPQTTGYLTGTAYFYDNTLNLSSLVGIQTVNLSGSGGLNGQAVGVTVPNVVGLAQAAATTAITGTGLAPGTISTASNGIVPSGSVIASNPAAGTQVNAGSAVRLLVSTGAAPPSEPNPLSFENNYFVTGDYASAGTSLRGLGGASGIASGTINIADSSTNHGVSQGVPDGADIIDGFLYWETLENTPSPSGGSGTFLGYHITGQQVGSDLPYNDGKYSGTLRVYRADVNTYFQGANGVRTGSGAFAISLPDGGSTFPFNEGASLVVIYRVLSQNFPLKSVVIYDGSAVPTSAGTQIVQGFYDAVGGATGESTTLFNASGSATWNNSSNSVTLPADASQFSTSLNSGAAYAAVIFSTPVNNSDGDGILNAWKAGPAAGDFYAGEPGYYDVKTGSWVPLPGATHGEKDLFVQLDYMCGNVLSNGSCDPTQENLFPSPDPDGNDPLAIVKNAFAADGIVLHLNIGNIVPESTCTDNLTTSPPQLCEFPSEPGVIGWKNSLEFSKLWPRNLASCEAGGDCSIRFPYGQKDSYHYVLMGHSLTIPDWTTPSGSITGIQAIVGGTTTITTTGIPTCPSRITISGVLGSPGLNGVYNTTGCTATTMTVATPSTVTTNWTYPNTLAEPVIGITSGTVTSISGYSDLGGQDSAVTLGLWETAPNQNMSKRANVIAGTLFHEIGHTLGLSHGGLYFNGSAGNYVPTFDVNCKPNYQSVMNYLFQLDGLGPNAAVAYSNQQLDGDPLGGPPAVLNDSSLTSGMSLTDASGNPATFSTSSWYAPYNSGTSPGSPATMHCDGTPLKGDSSYRLTGSIAPINPAWSSGQNIAFDGVSYSQLLGYNDLANIDLRQVGATGGEFASLASVLSFGSSSSTPLNIAAGGSVSVGAGGTVSVGNGGSVTLANGGNVTLGSSGSITLGTGGNVMFGSGSVATLPTGGTITPGTNGTVTLPNGGNVTLSNGGTITLTGGGSVSLTGAGIVALGSGGTITSSAGQVTIPSTGGSYTLPDSGGIVALGSGGSVTLSSGGIVALGSGGIVALGSGGTLTVGSGGIVALGSGGIVALGSGGIVALGSGGNFTLSGGGIVALGSGGTLTLGSGGIVALGSGGSVTLGSGGDLSVGSGGSVTLGGGGSATLGAGGSVTLGSGGSVAVQGGGNISLSSGGTITLSSGGNVTLGNPGTVMLANGGTVTPSGGSPVVVNPGGSYTFTSSGGIVALGSGGIVALGSGGVTLSSGGIVALGSGGIVALGSGGTVTLGGSGGIVALGSGGVVALGSGGIVALGSGGIVALGSGGIVALGSGGIVALGSGGATTNELTYETANSIVRPPSSPTETPTSSAPGAPVVINWTAPAFGVVATYTISRGSELYAPFVIGSVSGVDGNPPATTFTDTNPDTTSHTVSYTIGTTLLPVAIDPTQRQSPPSVPAVLTNNQTIVLGSLPSSVVLPGPQPITATAMSNNTANGLQVNFSATGPCSIASGSQSVESIALGGVSSATVTLSGTGSCIITASQPGATGFNAANSVSGSFTILPQGSNTQSQTINFAPLPNVQYGSTFSVSATASEPVTFTASGPCTVGTTTGTATGAITGVGLCKITASAPASAPSASPSYSAASLTQSFNILPATLTVTATSFTIQYGQALPTLTPTLGVTYRLSGFVKNGLGQLDTSSVVTGAPGLSTTATTSSNAGSYPITVSTGTLAAANYSFLYANGTLTIGQVSQAITFTTKAPPTAAYNASFPVAATGGASGNPVTFTSSGACSVTAGTTPGTATYTMTGSTGACSVIANQASSADYSAAPTVTEIVNTSGPLVTVSPSKISFGSVTLGSITTENITVSNIGTAPATISDPILSIVQGGNSNEFVAVNLCPTPLAAGKSCTITIAFVAGPFYTPQTATLEIMDNAPGSPQPVTLSATVLQPQTITFTVNPPATAAYNSHFTVAATGGASGNALIFTSGGACSNLGATYTMTGSTGTCSVIANQAGNTTYAPAAQVTKTVSATPAPQTITFTNSPPASAAYKSNFTAAATASSGLAVTFTSSGACSNSGATYTMTNSTGTCSVIANQAGNSNYSAAPRVTLSVAATLATQAITFTHNPPTSAAYKSTFTVAATASSGLAVTFTSSGACSNSGATYTMTSSTGTCSVIANQAGNSDYSAAPRVTLSVAATLATQAITFTNGPPATAAYNTSFTVAATGGASGNAVTFTSSGSCSNSGAKYTMTSGTGTCSVIANQAGNSDYTAATQVTKTVTATLVAQSITFTTNPPASAAYKSTFTVAAAGGASGNAVTFTSSGSCSNSGATYTMTSGTGTCSVIANQAGNSNYSAAAQVTKTVTATLVAQSITFTTNPPATAVLNTSFTVAATGGASGNAVVFTSSGSCSNSGATYKMTSGTGTCSVIANQAANSDYAAAPQITKSVTAKQ
jgi:sugar lactone lactonase YvrE